MRIFPALRACRPTCAPQTEVHPWKARPGERHPVLVERVGFALGSLEALASRGVTADVLARHYVLCQEFTWRACCGGSADGACDAGGGEGGGDAGGGEGGGQSGSGADGGGGHGGLGAEARAVTLFDLEGVTMAMLAGSGLEGVRAVMAICQVRAMAGGCEAGGPD